MSQPILALSGVDYTYEDGTQALAEVDLCLHPGERTVLLGANGSGKSTLFLLMAGVLQADRGTLSLDGRVLSGGTAELRSLRRRLGLVFQDPDSQLFANSVFEDVSFGPCNLGLGEAEVEARVEAALADCGIGGLRDKATHFLSYGQKKLVAIAGVVAMGCGAVLLDEPTSGLDGLHTELVENLLARLNAAGTAIIVSTHDMEFAWRFGHRAILMGGGRILAQGQPEALFRAEAGALQAAHIRPPLALRAHDTLARRLVGSRDLPLPPAPRRAEDLEPWASAILGVVGTPCAPQAI